MSDPAMLRSRPSVQAHEARFLQEAIAAGLPRFARSSEYSIHEPTLPSGNPDLVMVYARQRAQNKVIPSSRLTVRQLQVIHQLVLSRSVTSEQLASMLAESPRRLGILLGGLREAGYVVGAGTVRLRALQDIFHANRIVAIEAKLDNWRRAIQQARTNIWFSSDSYVLVPHSGVLESVVATARGCRVGVMTFDGTKVRTIIRAPRVRVPLSYGSWLFNEWLLHDSDWKSDAN